MRQLSFAAPYAQRKGVDELHDDAVSRLVDRLWHWEAMSVQHLSGELFRTMRSQRTFMNANSFCAASRLMYIQLADLRF